MLMCTRGVRCLGGVNFHPDAVRSPAQLCPRLDLAFAPLRAAAPRRRAGRGACLEGRGGETRCPSAGARRDGDASPSRRSEPGARLLGYAAPWSESACHRCARFTSPSRAAAVGARGVSVSRLRYQYTTGYSVGKSGSPHDVTPLRPTE